MANNAPPLQPGLSCQQIITLSAQIAQAPGFTSQAGQLLNLILQELAQQYNLAQSQGFFSFNYLTSPLTSTVNSANVVAGSGPYALPADLLRVDRGDFWWQLGGINYFPTPMDIAEFDQLVQQPGFTTYPTAYAIDTSTVPYGLYVWPSASGAYQAFMRYRKQTLDYTTPETSATVPWFPYQLYMVRRLAEEMMSLTGDPRQQAFHVTNNELLSRFLDMEGDNSTRAATVSLDRRKFGARWQYLSPTKYVPW